MYICPNPACHRRLAYPLRQCRGSRCPHCGYQWQPTGPVLAPLPPRTSQPALTAQALAQLENRRREEAERRERMDPYWGERLARIKKQNEHLDIIRDRVIAA